MLVVLMRIDERSGAQGRSRRKWSLGEFVYDRSVADRFETQFFQAGLVRGTVYYILNAPKSGLFAFNFKHVFSSMCSE